MCIPARGFFHCFGCGASGDVFAFLMRLEGSSFPEAARTLAERAGVEISEGDPQQDADFKRRRARNDRLYAIMDAAAGYYIEQLQSHPLSKLAKAELERRAISQQCVQTFRLGYAPLGWDGLLKFLAQKGHSLSEAEQLGLLVSRVKDAKGATSSEAYYDRFRNRLMFPVTDTQGRIVAFSGRILADPTGKRGNTK